METQLVKIQYGWVMVAIGAVITCVAAGAMFTLAVFLAPITQATGWSRAGVSAAMTLNFLTMGIGGFVWGALSDRFGTRLVILAGGVLLGGAMIAASRATSILEFQLVYGIFVGFATGSFFAPMMASVSGWFDKHRGLAVSLVSVGIGVAPMTISPFAAWLVTTTDWRTAELAIGVLVLATIIPLALFLRPPPQPALSQISSPSEFHEGLTVSQALRSTPFIVLALTFFACCATHSGPIFHTVSYAIGCGLPTMAAVTIYSVEGFAGLGGRLAFGLAADRFGVKPVLVGGLLIQALAAGAFVTAARLQEFYAVASVFGFAYGGVMPLYAVLARHYFGQKIMGTVFGAAAMISSLGMALGPSVGGWIFDTFHAYNGLYIASLAVGLGAAAIALAFPPFPRSPALQPA